MTALFFKGQITEGQCGIGRLFRCHTVDSYNRTYLCDVSEQYLRENYYTLDEPLNKSRHAGGTGFFGTGFINEERCRLFYERLCELHPLVFQTPVRVNHNSKRDFFYAMFDTTKQADVQYIQPKWPFKEE